MEVSKQFQLVPPHIHQINSAEQAIITFKEHFIAGLSSTHKDLLLHLWCRIVPHATLMLNLIRQYHMNPKISGYAQLHEEFDYNAMPLAPPSTKVIIHEKLTVRGTWAPHVVKWWYLGPSMNHYCCNHVYVTKTRGEGNSDCVEFFPHNTPLPYKSSAENAIMAAQELAYALQNPSPQEPFSNIGESQLVVIETKSKIFTKAANDGKSTTDPPNKQADHTASIIPQTQQTGWTEYTSTPQPNFIEDEEGLIPANFQHKVHRLIVGT